MSLPCSVGKPLLSVLFVSSTLSLTACRVVACSRDFQSDHLPLRKVSLETRRRCHSLFPKIMPLRPKKSSWGSLPLHSVQLRNVAQRISRVESLRGDFQVSQNHQVPRVKCTKEPDPLDREFVLGSLFLSGMRFHYWTGL